MVGARPALPASDLPPKVCMCLSINVLSRCVVNKSGGFSGTAVFTMRLSPERTRSGIHTSGTARRLILHKPLLLAVPMAALASLNMSSDNFQPRSWAMALSPRGVDALLYIP